MTSPIPQNARLALLMHGFAGTLDGKMGSGVLRYGHYPVVAVIDRTKAGTTCAETFGIDHAAPIVASVAEARSRGADTLLLAIATTGGVLPEGFRAEIVEGLRSGMNLINGLHGQYGEDREFAAARCSDAVIWDVRKEPSAIGPGTGTAGELENVRVLTVGTDMAVGKMTASLELHRASQSRGLKSAFLATGQIGIVISGDGVALDAVRVDFATGAVQQLVMRHRHAQVQWIEGQGSILHPGSTAWLGLMRGSQPTHLILTVRADQTHVDMETSKAHRFAIPPLPDVVRAYESVATASAGFANARVVGIALNSGHYPMGEHGDDLSLVAAHAIEAETGLPTVDVVRFGAGRLVDEVLNG